MRTGLHIRAPRFRRAISITGALALTFTIVARASAHDTWLISKANFGRVGTAVLLDLTSGETFPNDDFPITADRVKRAVVREAGVIRVLPRPMSTPLTLEYVWTPRAAGVATVGVELAPKTLTLDPKLINEYLGEIDASQEVRAAWRSLDGKQKWTESYTKHAMTFARIAPAKNIAWTEDHIWAKPMGLALEIVPEHDPTALHAGDTLPVRVLRRGAPMSGFSVGAIREGRTKAIFFRTDSAGRAGVILDAPGRWLLNGTDLRRSTTGRTVWESDFVTATLHVGARP